MYSCALCSVHVCSNGEFDKAPKNCPCIDEKAVEDGIIKPVDPNTAPRYLKYIPYWA